MFARTAWLIFRKDLTVEVRSRETIATTLFFAVSAVLVFAFVPSAQATPANAVPNPGFEEFVCGSSTLPDICA